MLRDNIRSDTRTSLGRMCSDIEMNLDARKFESACWDLDAPDAQICLQDKPDRKFTI